MIWYQKYGFLENPFSIKPNFGLVKQENVFRKVVEGINNGKIIIVTGDYGEGKTSLLKFLIKSFRGRRNLIYCNYDAMDKFDVESLLRGKYWILGKIFNLKGKNMILLLDEADDIEEAHFNEIVKYKEKGYLSSVVLFVKNIRDFIFNKALFVNLEKIGEDDAVQLVRNRIKDFPISDEVIKYIFRLSNFNPRELLKNCEEVCKYAVENNLEIDEELVKKILNVAPKDEGKIVLNVLRNRRANSIEELYY